MNDRLNSDHTRYHRTDSEVPRRSLLCQRRRRYVAMYSIKSKLHLSDLFWTLCNKSTTFANVVDLLYSWSV